MNDMLCLEKSMEIFRKIIFKIINIKTNSLNRTNILMNKIRFSKLNIIIFYYVYSPSSNAYSY